MSIRDLPVGVLQGIVTQNRDGIIVTDERGLIVYANLAFLELYGCDRKEVLGEPIVRFTDPENPERYSLIWNSLDVDSSWHGEIKERTRYGQSISIRMSISRIDHDDGTSRYAAIVRDNSKAKAYEESLWDMAMKDPLTELFNRRYFMDIIKRSIAHANRAKEPVGLILVDLDNFSNINNTMGHAAGDYALIQMAKRLKGVFQRESDVVARWGGDEFVIFLGDLDQDPRATGETICQKLVNALAGDYWIGDKLLNFTGSVGMSISYHDSASTDLLDSADRAMYKAKALGKNGYFINE